MDGPISISGLAKATGRSASLVSQQMRVLRDAKLVAGSRDGRQIVYAIRNCRMQRLLATCIKHALKIGCSR